MTWNEPTYMFLKHKLIRVLSLSLCSTLSLSVSLFLSLSLSACLFSSFVPCCVLSQDVFPSFIFSFPPRHCLYITTAGFYTVRYDIMSCHVISCHIISISISISISHDPIHFSYTDRRLLLVLWYVDSNIHFHLPPTANGTDLIIYIHTSSIIYVSHRQPGRPTSFPHQPTDSNINKMAITLTYFGIPGRAEATRVALAYAGKEFVDSRLAFPEYAACKWFGKGLPVLEVSDRAATHRVLL